MCAINFRLIIVFIILLRTFVVTPVRVDGNSMNDNLKDGEMIMVKEDNE